MSPLVSCLLLVFVTTAHSGVLDPRVADMDGPSPNIFGETEEEESMENSTPDYIDPPADPFEWAVSPWSGPLPSTVVLKTDIKYDNSLLEHFGYSHEKTKDWIKDVVQLTKPMMSHNSLSIKVALEIGEISHIDETLEADNHTIYYLAQTKNHKSLTSYFCKDNRRRGPTGIAFRGSACNMWAVNINELSTYSDRETAKTFAHELGHNIGMYHDFHESHGGHHGKCDHQGLMSYGQYPTQWSSCSDNDFTTWWKEKGHVCLKKTTDKHHGVTCGNHEASNCGGCPQGHGARWCHGDCRWWHGQCVARSGTGWGNW